MSHAPKFLALEAYAGGLLSTRATAQVERHLARCAECRQALAQVRAYAVLREDARAEQPAAPSWEQLEAALANAPQVAPAPARRKSGRLIALAWPLLAVAATLAIAWLGRSGPLALDGAQPVARPAATPAPEAPKLIGWVSLLAGSASIEHAGTRNPVTLDTPIQEGDTLRTAAAAQLHVAFGVETGFALAPESELQIRRLRVGETELALAAGRLTNQVQKLAERASYRVHVDALTASVRGTRFWVAHSAEPSVFVSEGRVEISRDGQLLAMLEAGHGYPAARFADKARPEGAPVHVMPASGANSFALVLPPLPTLHAWLVDGAPVSPAGTLAMRLPPGPTQLQFEDLRSQIRSIQVDLNAPLTALEPAALSELIAPKAIPTGYLRPEQISPVVRSAIEPLRRCYERNLRVEPKLESKFALRMRVSAEGRVVRSEVDAKAKLPLDLERCIEMETYKLIFPKPEGGGPVSFEVPLNLKSSR
jgi:hypothetical protein